MYSHGSGRARLRNDFTAVASANARTPCKSCRPSTPCFQSLGMRAHNAQPVGFASAWLATTLSDRANVGVSDADAGTPTIAIRGASHSGRRHVLHHTATKTTAERLPVSSRTPPALKESVAARTRDIVVGRWRNTAASSTKDGRGGAQRLCPVGHPIPSVCQQGTLRTGSKGQRGAYQQQIRRRQRRSTTAVANLLLVPCSAARASYATGRRQSTATRRAVFCAFLQRAARSPADQHNRLGHACDRTGLGGGCQAAEIGTVTAKHGAGGVRGACRQKRLRDIPRNSAWSKLLGVADRRDPSCGHTHLAVYPLPTDSL